MTCLFEGSLCEPLTVSGLCRRFISEVNKINRYEINTYSEYLHAIKQVPSLERAYLYRAELFRRLVFDKTDSFLDSFEEFSEEVHCMECSNTLNDTSLCYQGLSYEKTLFLCDECFSEKDAAPINGAFVFGCRAWVYFKPDMIERVKVKRYNKMLEMLEKDLISVQERLHSIHKTRAFAQALQKRIHESK
jgi:hypothetical protein